MEVTSQSNEDRPMNHQEHAARAMLMDLIYDWRDGTYCEPSTSILEHGPVPGSEHIIDCISLEVMTYSQAEDRVKTWHTVSVGYNLNWTSPKPTLLVPYDADGTLVTTGGNNGPE